MKKKTKGQKIIDLHLKGYKAKEIAKKTKAKIGYVYSAISLYRKDNEWLLKYDTYEDFINKHRVAEIGHSADASLFTKIKSFFGM